MKRTRYSLQEVMKEYLLLEGKKPKKGDIFSVSANSYYIKGTDNWLPREGNLNVKKVRAYKVGDGDKDKFVYFKSGDNDYAVLLTNSFDIEPKEETPKEETPKEDPYRVKWSDIWNGSDWEEKEWEEFVDEAYGFKDLKGPAAAAAKWNWKKAAPKFGFTTGNVSTAKKFYTKVKAGNYKNSSASLDGVVYKTGSIDDPTLPKPKTESLSRGALIRRRYYGRY